jgi:hypothetical protein
MAREVQHAYSSCAELDGKLQSKESDYIALTAVAVKAYETKEVGDNFFRNVFVADTADAKGKLRVSLKGRQRKYLDNLKEGNRYVFKGFLNMDKETGSLSIGGAYATRVKEEVSASGGGGRDWNPRAPIIGVLIKAGMASFAPIPFSNSDWKSNDAELGSRIDCMKRIITRERVDAFLAKQKTEDKPEPTEESEDPELKELCEGDPFGEEA